MQKGMKRLASAWLLAALAAGLFVCLCGFSCPRLPRGCFVGGVDVSRLTRPAAAARVNAALEEELAGRTFTVRVENCAYVFRPPELHWQTDLRSVLRRANAPGAYPLQKKLCLRALDSTLRGVCDDFYETSAPARVAFDPQNAAQPFAVEPERCGAYVDGAALKKAVLEALGRGESGVQAQIVHVRPAFTRERAERSVSLLASFTTRFNAENTDRAHNIALAAGRIHGTVLAAGETFSFNAAAGARTKENGYREAPVIFDGEFVSGTGGGVCQVSTTVYNAALLAGMRIAEYHPHSLAVGYVEPSFDAMVSGTACDLKFCNESGGAVYVLCRVNENALTVSLYGEQTGVTYLRESVVTATVPPPEPELREGEEEKELRAAKNGVRSEGWLVRREAGREDVRTLLRRDSYAPVRAIRQVPPSAAEPVPQQPPAAG